MIKKLLVLMAFGSCFAAPWDSVGNLTNSAQCTKNCDPGAIMKVLNVDSAHAKTLSTTACQTACADDCFAGKMNDSKTGAAANVSETAALACKDSLKKTFKLN